MHIGNRIFPYPVLNRNEALSNYVAESTFKLEFDVDENGAPIVKNGEVVFKNLHFTLTDSALIELLEQGKLRGAFIVECSASVYRSRFDISTTPYDLHVSAHEINGNVVASCYLYATEDITDFHSMGFIEEYAGYSFDIDKFDILAVDDGFKFKIELDPTEDDKVASIFTVVKKEDSGDIMSYVYNDKKIIIHLPSAYFDCYNNIKTKRECNNIAFAMLAIPVLSGCLDDISARYESMEEILEYYSWFNAVCISYKRKTGNKLTFEDFDNMNKLELAQMVMNSASCNGLKDFDNMLLGGMNTTEEGMKMSKIHIKYMSDEALETLKANIDVVTGKLIENPDCSAWLKTFFPGTLWVTKKYEIDEFTLRVPTDDKDRETDLYNSVLLYERLKHLPLYVLTDERFWCWMNFEMGYKVALKYMPVKKGSSIFKDHWLLTQGKRRGLFFGVLSRCYFRVALSIDNTLEDPYELTKFVIENPLRFRELTWRSFSSEKMIVLGTLKAEKRVLTEYPKWEENAKKYGEVAKLISKLGSVMLLDCMTEKDIEEYVYKKFKAIVEEDLASRGMFQKIKDAVVAVLHG